MLLPVLIFLVQPVGFQILENAKLLADWGDTQLSQTERSFFIPFHHTISSAAAQELEASITYNQLASIHTKVRARTGIHTLLNSVLPIHKTSLVTG